MLIMLYDAWANNPFLLAIYAFMAVLALAILAIYIWRAYLGPQGWHDNPVIGQVGQIIVWEPHDKRIKLKDVFWQVQAAANQPPFSVGDWVQVVAQDNLVLTIVHYQLTE